MDFFNHYYKLINMEDTVGVDQQLRQEFLKLHKPARYGTAGFRDLA